MHLLSWHMRTKHHMRSYESCCAPFCVCFSSCGEGWIHQLSILSWEPAIACGQGLGYAAFTQIAPHMMQSALKCMQIRCHAYSGWLPYLEVMGYFVAVCATAGNDLPSFHDQPAPPIRISDFDRMVMTRSHHSQGMSVTLPLSWQLLWTVLPPPGSILVHFSCTF